MDQAGLIFALYSIMMFLMIAFIPLVAIMSIVNYLTRKAKQGYREVTK